MKLPLFIISLCSISFCYGQSELTDPATNCKYVLPWICTECTFNWTGLCENGSPKGIGILTVFNSGNDIMRYEGEMKNGKFDGEGSYRDGMNEIAGKFEDGNYLPTNPFIEKRKASRLYCG